MPGLINVDFADVKAIMTNAGEHMAHVLWSAQQNSIFWYHMAPCCRQESLELLRHAYKEQTTSTVTIYSPDCFVLTDVAPLPAAAGTAMLGVGCAVGPDRAEQAALAAVSAPLIQQSVERATGKDTSNTALHEVKDILVL